MSGGPRNRNKTLTKHKKTTPKYLPTIAQQTTINFKKTLTTFNLRYNLTTSITVTKATYSKLSNRTAITKGLKTKIGKQIKLKDRFYTVPLRVKPTNKQTNKLLFLDNFIHTFALILPVAFTSVPSTRCLSPRCCHCCCGQMDFVFDSNSSHK